MKKQSKNSMNRSGITPVECRILVLPDETDKVTPGGIMLPGAVSDRNDLAQTIGIMVAKGASAFCDWQDAPENGQKVYIAKYAGLLIKGDDGRDYRLCDDRDVAAIGD